jgi:hypothetical protein
MLGAVEHGAKKLLLFATTRSALAGVSKKVEKKLFLKLLKRTTEGF